MIKYAFMVIEAKRISGVNNSEVAAPPLQTDNEMLAEKRKIESEMGIAAKRFESYAKRVPVNWSTRQRAIEIFQSREALKKNIFGTYKDDPGIVSSGIDYAISVASEFLNRDAVREKTNLARKHDLGDKYEDLRQLLDFALCGELFLKNGEISIEDVFKRKNPLEYLKLALDAGKALQAPDITQYASGNSKIFPLTNGFVQITIHKFLNAQKQMACLAYVSPPSLLRPISTSTKTEREILDKAIEIVTEISGIKNSLVNILFNPDSKEFSVLKSIIEPYLDSDSLSDKVDFLLKIGLDDQVRTISIYRMAKFMAKNSLENVDFYGKLLRAVEEFVAIDNDIISKKITDQIIKPDGTGDGTVPDFNDLKLFMGKILSKCSKTGYVIDINNFNFSRLQKPAEIRFSFLTPHIIGVVLSYKTDQGKNKDFAIEVDTKRNRIGWNALEDPDDPDMQNLRTSSLVAMKEVLSNVQKQAEALYSERHRPNVVFNREIVVPKVKKERTSWISREKIEKPKPKPLSTTARILESKPLPTNEAIVRASLEFPQVISYKDLMRDVSRNKDRERILEKINLLREFGSNKFKAISAIHEGKTVYELRVGDYRVLAVPKDSKNGNGSGNGICEYEIFKIDNRRSVFGKTTKKFY